MKVEVSLVERIGAKGWSRFFLEVSVWTKQKEVRHAATHRTAAENSNLHPEVCF